MLKKIFNKILKIAGLTVAALAIIPISAFCFMGLGKAVVGFIVLTEIIAYFGGFFYIISNDSDKKEKLPYINPKEAQEKLPPSDPKGQRERLEFFDKNDLKVEVEYTDDNIVKDIVKLIYKFREYIESNGKTFKYKLLLIINYSVKFVKKRNLIDKSLLSHLDKTELSFAKFSTILLNIDNSVKQNLNDILMRLLSFDETEYEEILKYQNPSSRNYIERKDIFDEYVNYINTSINFLDSILIKIDKLQLESTKIKSLDVNDIDNLTSIKDIDNLIKTMKFYKV
ncbi:MAG: hypothetical protein LBS60_03095 [Deltaproteobacteria bacterium]|jgi:hypothetical protein|nr:hypothetical protein [Deltaproteobacteria bacterium]